MSLLVDKEILFYAFRYALGRMTFAPITVMDSIKLNLSELSAGDIRLFIKEIDECNHYGMDFDKIEWLNFRDYLQKELNNR